MREGFSTRDNILKRERFMRYCLFFRVVSTYEAKWQQVAFRILKKVIKLKNNEIIKIRIYIV